MSSMPLLILVFVNELQLDILNKLLWFSITFNQILLSPHPSVHSFHHIILNLNLIFFLTL